MAFRPATSRAAALVAGITLAVVSSGPTAAQHDPDPAGRAGAAVGAAHATAPWAGHARFNSVFPSLHDAITDAGFAGVPISRSMLRLVRRANRTLDVESVKLLPTVASLGRRLVPGPAYRHHDHFDRPADLTHDAAYAASLRAVLASTERVVAMIGSGEHEAAARLLGRVLHAWQDLAAHSNIAFLDDDDDVRALPSSPDAAPAGLRLTSYDGRARNPEQPDDPLGYAHADFALDHAGKNPFARETPAGGTRTRFEIAVATATEFTALSIAHIARAVAERHSPEAWHEFLAHDATRATAAWSAAVVADPDRPQTGFRIGRRITDLAPGLQAALGAFTDRRVELGLQLGADVLGPRVHAFAIVNHTLSRRGLSVGGGADVRVVDRAWVPDLRVAGTSDRGLLVGLATRF